MNGAKRMPRDYLECGVEMPLKDISAGTTTAPQNGKRSIGKDSWAADSIGPISNAQTQIISRTIVLAAGEGPDPANFC